MSVDYLLRYDGGKLVSADLDRKNPTSVEELERRPLPALLDDMERAQREVADLIEGLRSATAT